MKIAILSDIHSNLQALEAAIGDAMTQRVDRFAVAGDLITDGPDATAVLERVQALDCPVIKGNREDYILRYRNGERQAWEGSSQMAALLWANQNLKTEDYRYLAGLPEQAVMDLGEGVMLRIVHGSPFSMYELLQPYEDMPAVERAALAVREQALAFGHNHMQWTGTVHGRLLVNPGSVGVHFNKERKAEYAILTNSGGSLAAELRQVAYDFTALEKRLETSGLMAAAPVWTRITFEGVKAGRNYCLYFLEDARRAMQGEGISQGMIPNRIWAQVARKWWKNMDWGACPE